MKLSNRESNRKLRAIGTLITIAAVFGALCISPQQAPVVLFKLSLVTLAAVAAYWIDKILNPHVDNGILSQIISRPIPEVRVEKREATEFCSAFNYHNEEDCEKRARAEDERKIAVDLYKAAMIRRAIITFAIVVGVCLGL